MTGSHADDEADDHGDGIDVGADGLARLESWLVREADRQRVEADDHPDAERGHDLVVWLLRAARLAAAGGPPVFDDWPRLAADTGVDVMVAIRQAGHEAIELLGDARGEPLAEALIDAEDACCLSAIEPERTGLLPPAIVSELIGLWVEAAGESVVDERACERLEHHRRAWRPAGGLGLPVIDARLDELDLRLAVADCPPPIRLAPVFSYVEEAVTFDSGRPTEGMMRRFDERRGEGVAGDGRLIRVEGVLDPQWRVTVWIRGAGTALVRSVRLGTMAMAVDPDFEPDPASGAEAESRPYFVSLAGLPLDVRTRLVCSEIAVSTVIGERFIL